MGNFDEASDSSSGMIFSIGYAKFSGSGACEQRLLHAEIEGNAIKYRDETEAVFIKFG
jgi:hypothetical protein